MNEPNDARDPVDEAVEESFPASDPPEWTGAHAGAPKVPEEISDDYMRSMLQTTKTYTLLILRPGPKPRDSWDQTTIWEHGRRNFALRAQGLLSIVCPVRDGSDVAGIGLFNAPIEQVDALMKEDPAVKAGILVYELHPCRSFPGDALPA